MRMDKESKEERKGQGRVFFDVLFYSFYYGYETQMKENENWGNEHIDTIRLGLVIGDSQEASF